MMAECLRESVSAFSYPNGYCNAAVVRQVADAGYQLAFTTRGGFVRCDDDRLMVRRFNIHDGVANTAPTFLARVVGLL